MIKAIPALAAMMNRFNDEFKRNRNLQEAKVILSEIRRTIYKNLDREFEISIDINTIFDTAHHTKFLDQLQEYLEVSALELREDGFAICAQIALSTNDLIIAELFRRKLDQLALKSIEASDEAYNHLTIRNALWFLANLLSSPEANKAGTDIEDLVKRIMAAVKNSVRNMDVSLKLVQFFSAVMSIDRDAYSRLVNQDLIHATMSVLFESPSAESHNDCLFMLNNATKIAQELDEAPFAIMVNYIIAEGFIEKFLRAASQSSPGFEENTLILFWRVLFNFASFDAHIEVDRVVSGLHRV